MGSFSIFLGKSQTTDKMINKHQHKNNKTISTNQNYINNCCGSSLEGKTDSRTVQGSSGNFKGFAAPVPETMVDVI